MCCLILLFSFSCLLRKPENKFRAQVAHPVGCTYKLLLLSDWELSINGEGTNSLLKKLHV